MKCRNDQKKANRKKKEKSNSWNSDTLVPGVLVPGTWCSVPGTVYPVNHTAQIDNDLDST